MHGPPPRELVDDGANSGSGRDLVQEAVHAADLAVGVEDRDVEPDHQRLPVGRPQVPGEPGLVVVRVDWPAE